MSDANKKETAGTTYQYYRLADFAETTIDAIKEKGGVAVFYGKDLSKEFRRKDINIERIGDSEKERDSAFSKMRQCLEKKDTKLTFFRGSVTSYIKLNPETWSHGVDEYLVIQRHDDDDLDRELGRGWTGFKAPQETSHSAYAPFWNTTIISELEKFSLTHKDVQTDGILPILITLGKYIPGREGIPQFSIPGGCIPI